MEKLFSAIGVICAAFLAIVFRGWVITMMWGWFFVPTFNLPQLTIPQAVGISIVMTLLAKNIESDTKKTLEESMNDVLKSALYLLVFLGCAWIVTLFM